jgi:hypothetical protein
VDFGIGIVNLRFPTFFLALQNVFLNKMSLEDFGLWKCKTKKISTSILEKPAASTFREEECLFTLRLYASDSWICLFLSKVKCTFVQALRLCTGHTAHRGSRDIALLFLDHGTRRA